MTRSTPEAPPTSSFGNLALLLEPPDRPDRRWWTIFAGSMAVHLVSFGFFMASPSFISPQARRREPQRQVVKLYLPPELLTQKVRNLNRPSPSIDIASLMSPQAQQPRQAAPAPSVRHFEVPNPTPVQKTAPQILAQAPAVSPTVPAGTPPPGAITGLPQPATPPPPVASSQPFQNIGSEDHSDIPKHKLATPNTSVDGAVQSLAQKSNSGHLVITDDSLSQPSPGASGTNGTGTAPHAQVELQSDPQGADFRAYLAHILGIVRSNWRRVLPESARMGQLRGSTVIEFIISRDGSIPKLVTADESGSNALDLAAVAGLSMSNPLPPLPSDFKGQQVRLAFTFSVEARR